MVELAKRLFGWTNVRLEAKPLPEPEAINGKPRTMTGFFAGLTPDQKKEALAYRGDDTHGEDAYLRA